jgi:hypothetical protein
VLTVGADDARFLHALFPGSHWMGQVGTLPSLRELERCQTQREPGKIERLARAILGKLETLDKGIEKISSRALRGLMEADEQCNDILTPKGSDCMVSIPPRTWASAVTMACSLGSSWQKQGQSLLRVTAALYGFRNAA